LLRRTTLACVVLASFAASGCGGAPSSSRSPAGVIHVTERDFKISAPKVVSAGDHVLAVQNHGPDDHELIVAREGKAHLPFRADGVTIDEDAAEHAIAGALEPGEPGKRELRVHLRPGHYVLFCNMSGHYLGGMDTDIEVR
jgi:uncharacterized cupredoxin-like copper-binding protein